MIPDKTLEIVQDSDRLATLRQFDLLDTPPEEVLDRLTRLASKITGSPISLISLVDADRQFFKSLFGLPEPFASARETPLSHSFCQHVVARDAALVLEDARDHPLLKDNQAIPDMDAIGYLGMPLRTTDGVTLGSFCVIDNKPREWREEEIEIMRELALSAMAEIELRFQIQERLKVEKQVQDLTSMIVHDMRTPLSIVLGTLALLEDLLSATGESSKLTKMVEMSKRAASQVDGLVGEMLVLSKMEAGQLFELDQTDLELGPYLSAREKFYAALADLNGVQFELEVAADLPSVIADQSLIGRVVDNLVSNAVKFSPMNSTVKLTATAGEGEVTVAVRDQGRGIEKKDQAHIFDKFYQIQGNESFTPRRGVGIGLAFCKQTVEAHNGRIWVESEPGQGSTFAFALPTA